MPKSKLNWVWLIVDIMLFTIKTTQIYHTTAKKRKLYSESKKLNYEGQEKSNEKQTFNRLPKIAAKYLRAVNLDRNIQKEVARLSRPFQKLCKVKNFWSPSAQWPQSKAPPYIFEGVYTGKDPNFHL